MSLAKKCNLSTPLFVCIAFIWKLKRSQFEKFRINFKFFFEFCENTETKISMGLFISSSFNSAAVSSPLRMSVSVFVCDWIVCLSVCVAHNTYVYTNISNCHHFHNKKSENKSTVCWFVFIALNIRSNPNKSNAFVSLVAFLLFSSIFFIGSFVSRDVETVLCGNVL